MHIHLLSTPNWIWPSQPPVNYSISTSSPFLHANSPPPRNSKPHLLLTFFWCCLSPKPQSSIKNTAFLPQTVHEGKTGKKNTYISTLALIVKSIMGIKPTSWVKSMKQVLIPRRAIISRITLMHRSHDEERNKEKREMVHARELNSQTDFPFGLIIPCTEWQLFHCRHLWLTQLAFLRVKTYFLSSPPHLFFNCWHKLLLQFASQSLPH